MAKRDVRYFAEILYGVLEGVPKDGISSVIKKFLHWAESQGARGMFPKLLAIYGEVVARKEGIPRVEVRLARKMPEIDKLVKQALKNKEVAVETKIESEILGGMIVQIDDVRLDASLRGRINDLKKVLAYGHH